MDLELISGHFLDSPLDKSKEYLLHYFEEEPQRAFLVYCFHFPKIFTRAGKPLHEHFVAHTGVYCSHRAIHKWSKRLRDLESALQRAYAESDLDTLSQIKGGTFRLKRAKK